MEIAKRLGFAVEERAFALHEIMDPAEGCPEVLVVSTVTGVLPAVHVGGEVVGSGKAGPVTIAILQAMREEQARAVGLEPPPALAAP